MSPTPNRNLPEVVSELPIEMHEIGSKWGALTKQVDSLKQIIEIGFEELRQKFWDKTRQNTSRLIEAFSRSMAPLISEVLGHETRLNNLENSQA
jgi:hypothetical protein